MDRSTGRTIQPGRPRPSAEGPQVRAAVLHADGSRRGALLLVPEVGQVLAAQVDRVPEEWR